jgi:hypothetical protein
MFWADENVLKSAPLEQLPLRFVHIDEHGLGEFEEESATLAMLTIP